MSYLAISGTKVSSPLLLSAYADPAESNQLTLNATVTDIPPQSPIVTNPADPGGSGYPGITAKPTPLLITSVYRTQFLIDGIDYGNFVFSADWKTPKSGLAEGQVTLYELPDSPLENTIIRYGDPFEFKQCWQLGGTISCILVGRGYVINQPYYYVNNDGIGVLEIDLGDELALFSNQIRLQKTKYCGPAPTTAGEAARIYAITHGLITTTFPAGHNLVDLGDRAFSNESPYQYLQALYYPTDRDVRCNINREIVALTNPSYIEADAKELSFDTVFQLQDNRNTETFKQVRAHNQFTQYEPFSIRGSSSTIRNGDPSNDNPYFKGGYTETDITLKALGDTEISRKEIVRGYLPSSLSYTDAQAEEDSCDPSTISTFFTKVEENNEYINYVQHESGAYLVHRKTIEKYARRLSKTPTGYDIDPAFRLQERTIIDYINRGQVNPEVCVKDYIHLQTGVITQVFKTDDNGRYRLFSTTREYYYADGEQPGVDQPTYIGAATTWRKHTSGRFLRDDLTGYDVQPTAISYEKPNSSEWIRPRSTTVTGFVTVQDFDTINLFDTAPYAVEAPFCYTIEQLSTYATKWISSNNGLAERLTVVVPYFLRLNLGDYIRFTNKSGTLKIYQIEAIEINQTVSDATKTLTLKHSRPRISPVAA